MCIALVKMTKNDLNIKDLFVNRDTKSILKGVSLQIKSGEIHAVMGPNGSGKSTLANALMGNSNFEIVSGTVEISSKNILNMEPFERSREGLFMAFQYPVEVPGVPLIQFLKLIYETRFDTKITPGKFLKLVQEKAEILNVKKDLLNRYLNVGFSGGEKKKIEILQMFLLEPKFAVLDETDSGLDVSALKVVAEGVKEVQKQLNMGVLVITHYSRILDYLKPNYVHILQDGKISETGDFNLAKQIESKGY